MCKGLFTLRDRVYGREVANWNPYISLVPACYKQIHPQKIVRYKWHSLPPANEVCEGYVFYTCLSFCPQGVCLSACWDTPPPKQNPPGPGTNPPLQCMLGDMVNKRAVCILLECNLVVTELILY